MKRALVCLIPTGFLLLCAAWAWADHRPRTHDRGGAPADVYAPPPVYQPYPSPYVSPYGRPLDLSPPPVYRPWPPDYRPTPDSWDRRDRPRSRSIWDD